MLLVIRTGSIFRLCNAGENKTKQKARTNSQEGPEKNRGAKRERSGWHGDGGVRTYAGSLPSSAVRHRATGGSGRTRERWMGQQDKTEMD